MMVKNVYALL